MKISTGNLRRLIESTISEASEQEEWWINWRRTKGTPAGKKKLIQRVKKQELPRMKERSPSPRFNEMQTALKMAEALKTAGEKRLANKLKDAVESAAKSSGQTLADVKAGKPRRKSSSQRRPNAVAAAKASTLKGKRELEDGSEFAAAQADKRARERGSKYDFLDDEEEFEFDDGAFDDKPKKGSDVASSKGKAPPIESIIKNKMQGNAFRTWVNETHEEYARKIDLDDEGSHNNKYIKTAWEKHGKEFMNSSIYKNVQIGDKKIPFSKLGTKGNTGEEGDQAIRVKGKVSEGSKLTRGDIVVMLEELLRTEEPSSEMSEFSSSGPGKKVMKEGRKIMSAGKAINDLAYHQTGAMRRGLGRVSEFVYKLGEALSSLDELEENESMSSKLPSVNELRQLHKEIKRLEKL